MKVNGLMSPSHSRIWAIFAVCVWGGGGLRGGSYVRLHVNLFKHTLNSLDELELTSTLINHSLITLHHFISSNAIL